VNVRRATFYDAGSILRILTKMHSESEVFKHFPVDVPKAAMMITSVLTRGLSFVAETDEDGVIGSIGGMVSPGLWYSSQPFLGDLWFYVDSAFRQNSAAIELIDIFLEEAKKHNLPVQLGHVAGSDLDRKDKFFERRGLVKMGSIYLSAPESSNG